MGYAVLWFTFLVSSMILSITGAQRGKLGVHEWDINIPETASLDLLIVSQMALTPYCFEHPI